MRALLFLITSVVVVALAFWAYRENYDTQSVMKEARELQRDISSARERLRVLNAEWAYLNRPERLRELVNMNFQRLELLPIESAQYSSISQLPYPQPEMLAVIDMTGAATIPGAMVPGATAPGAAAPNAAAPNAAAANATAANASGLQSSGAKPKEVTQ